MQDQEKINEIELIDRFAKIHFKHCLICIPGALDLPLEKRLCSEGQELALLRNNLVLQQTMRDHISYKKDIGLLK